jgi:hypothetical protein
VLRKEIIVTVTTPTDRFASRFCDRSSWPPGPWDDEDDRMLWLTKPGLSGLIVRNEHLGNLCGYVGVPPGHPAHGAGYPDDLLSKVKVHGGLTYSSPSSRRVALSDETDLWWLGFDCLHTGLGDSSPAASNILSIPGGEYRSIGYVYLGVESLAAQLAALGS